MAKQSTAGDAHVRRPRNMLSGDDDAPLEEGYTRQTPLHDLGELSDPFGYSTQENQLILANGAAKFLLNWLITTRSGASSLARVRSRITDFFNAIALHDNPDRVQRQFLLRQWN
jgi:hypothetical protein